MPLMVQGRLIGVTKEDAVPAKDGREAKDACLKLDVYDSSAKRKNKCLEVKAPIELEKDLTAELGEIVSYPVNIYAYAMGSGADFSLSLIVGDK